MHARREVAQFIRERLTSGLNRAINQLTDDVRSGQRRIGECFLAAMMHVGQFAVIETKLMQNSCVQVRNPHFVLDCAITKVISGSVYFAVLETTAR